MKYEKSCFISPTDITGVRLKCTECGASRTIPVEKLANANLHIVVTDKCPHCHTESNFPARTIELNDFVQFNALLSKLSKLVVGRNIEYRLEIACPPENAE